MGNFRFKRKYKSNFQSGIFCQQYMLHLSIRVHPQTLSVPSTRLSGCLMSDHCTRQHVLLPIPCWASLYWRSCASLPHLFLTWLTKICGTFCLAPPSCGCWTCEAVLASHHQVLQHFLVRVGPSWDYIVGFFCIRILSWVCITNANCVLTCTFHDCESAELECLFWGQYFSSSVALSTPKAGLHMVTQKWCLTLQELDIGNQLFTAEDLEAAMGHLAQATEAETLRSLNLSGTRITPPALRYFLFEHWHVLNSKACFSRISFCVLFSG